MYIYPTEARLGILPDTPPAQHVTSSTHGCRGNGLESTKR